ncbi:MAG: isoleucine--tRNA ligase [Parvibaculaceae bacterium]|nr:isoleucine--tRNA ligase [Parvibaculaceae bacterium]
MSSDTDTPVAADQGRDYRNTLFLPETGFPMKAGLPATEPKWLERWEQLGLYERLREQSRSEGRELFVLHDGPPYANGNIHIGHALNKILKDIITRSQQMMGKNANYVPGWDCHGLPIEWMIEERYRAKGVAKEDVPAGEFRRACRDYAAQWIDTQREEFKRLGVVGDWKHPYTTMDFNSEAKIVEEFLKFAQPGGGLYRGSKPIMWSIVEKTALAEAEVEYHEHTSSTIFVKFPVDQVFGSGDVNSKAELEALRSASVVIWTTTPWTIPGNRGIAYSETISYGLYEVTDPGEARYVKAGERLLLADSLAGQVRGAAHIGAWTRLQGVSANALGSLICKHPFHASGYDFKVPVVPGDFVTDETGTGFVHLAPGHGADDYALFTEKRSQFAACGTRDVPHTVQADGSYFPDVPIFGGTELRVLDAKGKDGGANGAVIEALIEAGALLAQGKLRHQYPHSWRSKAPLIFRNTPQWFISMDTGQLRKKALAAIDETRFVPAIGRNRLRSMIENRPDWVISRQRAWGVPLTIFVRKKTGEILHDDAVNRRILDAVRHGGADAWFELPDSHFLGDKYVAGDYEKIEDILDVWFDSGCTHAFVLEEREDLKWPADVYLEGSDQHRGWFHSSLLESCGTRGRAPYDQVVTHGMTLDEQGRKMSKSVGNTVVPQKVIDQNGADILRLWVSSTDYWEDQRLGPEIIKSTVDAYRKLRNTFRFLLGNLAGFAGSERVGFDEMPELERYMLHRIAELDGQVRQYYGDYDFKRIFQALTNFMTVDLSAFYFDIRKDTLYCDPKSAVSRRACRTVLDILFSHLTAWFAPILSFTMEEVWLTRFPSEEDSVHFRTFPPVPAVWLDHGLADKWEKVRELRRAVTGALEVERRDKRIGSSLEAAPEVYVSDPELMAAMEGVDLAEIAITSQARLIGGEGPSDAFRLDEVPGVAVVPRLAEGRKCARSWKISDDVGSVPGYPDLSPRDAAAVAEYDAEHGAA